MKYDYNGHLSFEDKVYQVANEIITEYPMIAYDKAIEIAFYEERITTKKDCFMELKRLYNILFVISDEKEKFKIVLKDLSLLFFNNLELRDKYYILFDMLQYYNGRLDCFPIEEI